MTEESAHLPAARKLMGQAREAVSPDDVPAGWAVWQDTLTMWHGYYNPKPSLEELEADVKRSVCATTRPKVLAEIADVELVRARVNRS